MANKKTDFAARQKGVIDPMRAKATSDTRDTKDAKNISDTPDTSDTERTEYRFSARFTPEQWAYLRELKWQTRRTLTAILQDYVDADMKKHPEIIAKIDDLNK